MGNTQHTPTPWKVLIDSRGEPNLWGADGILMGTLYHDGISDAKPIQLANAEFIVRACNNHDDLLAAMESCEREMSNAYRKGLVDSLAPKAESSSFTQAVSVARAVIAKAKEKP